MDWVVCFAIGGLAGMISGLLGAGAGWIIVPGLALGLPYAGLSGPDIIKIAIGTSQATVIFTTLATVRVYAEKGNIDWTAGWRMLPGCLIGVIGGSMIAAQIDVRYCYRSFYRSGFLYGFAHDTPRNWRASV